MSKTADWNLKKAGLKWEARNKKPEKPRFQDQIALMNQSSKLQQDIQAPDRAADAQSFKELDENWKSPGGGSRGDALISGLSAGLKKGGFSEDKKRNAQMLKFTEQMEKMVAEQNRKLWEDQKEADATQAVTPRIMAYLDQYQSMDPNKRKVYLQETMDEFNQSAGTNYKIVDATGSEPWKVMVSDGESIQPLDLMDFIKTPEERKLELYLKSNEVQAAERGYAQEDALNRQDKQAGIQQKQAKAMQVQQEIDAENDYKKIEDEVFQQAGDKVEVLDRFKDKPSQWNYLVKTTEEKIKEGNAARKSVQILDRLGQIVQKNPAIFNSLGAVLENSHAANPSALSTLATNLSISKKDRADFEEAGKLLANLYATDLHTMPKGSRLNQFLEKEFKKKVPNLSLVPEAFTRIQKQLTKEGEEIYEEGAKASNYYQKGLILKPKIKAIDRSNNVVEKLRSADPTLTPEMIEEAQRIKNARK